MRQHTSVETVLQQGHNQLDRGQYQAAFINFQKAALLQPQNLQVVLIFTTLSQQQIANLTDNWE